MTTTSDRVSLAKRFYEAVAASDLAAVAATMPQLKRWTYHGSKAQIPFGGTADTPSGATDFFVAFGEAIEPIEFSIDSFAADGNRVFARGIEHSRVKSTGKEYRVEWVHAMVFENGGMVSFEEFLDSSTVAAAFVS